MRKKIKEHKPSELLQMVLNDPAFWQDNEPNMLPVLDRFTSSKQVLRKDSKALQRRLDSLEMMGMCLSTRICRVYSIEYAEYRKEPHKWVRQYWETKIQKFKEAGI